MSCTPGFSAPYYVSATLMNCRPNVAVGVNAANQGLDATKERIKKMFDRIELSASPYDTAWVAMVSSPSGEEAPFFPQCTRWILDNQLSDGSWGFHRQHPLLVKDALSSTLACVLALKKWGIGEEQVNRGLRFIELNSSLAIDDKQHTPIGFDIIFPSMIEHAKDLKLNLPLKSTDINAMQQRKHLELKSIHNGTSRARDMYLAYVSEGIGKLQDWEMVMKYQRKNGSLFNSPSTTAAAFNHLQNSKCLRYLHSLLDKFGDAVPTIYPLDLYARLFMIDSLTRLGISRHFREEIKAVLDQTYRCWLQGEEEIFLDSATCALAFRMLRISGYDVSAGVLDQYAEEQFYNSLDGYLKNTGAALELYRASEITYPDESLLEKQNSWTKHFLKQELSNGSIFADRLRKDISLEVHDALNFPFHADLDRLANRRSIEQYATDNIRILKSSYCCTNMGNKDFLKLAVEDFNFCQSIEREELQYLERWAAENRLDKLKFARQKVGYCYFSSAATIFAPELSAARISWAKNSVLTTVVDDFFDVGGTQEELLNLVELFEKWDVAGNTKFCSEQVEIIYSAIRCTICEIADKAFALQGRDVTSHVANIWLNLLKSMLAEAQWTRNMSVPTLEEYMTNAFVSFALGPIVLPALYLVGPSLPEDAVRHPEYDTLFELMSTCGRLLNDWRGFKRESKEGKLNAVSLQLIHSGGRVTEEGVIETIKTSIHSKRKQLLRLVLQEKDSKVPRPCKDLFWNMIKVLHLFYKEDDGFTSNVSMVSAAKAVLNERISLDILS